MFDFVSERFSVIIGTHNGIAAKFEKWMNLRERLLSSVWTVCTEFKNELRTGQL
jgi:hypothetical protein